MLSTSSDLGSVVPALVSRLPDVGAPASLLYMALLGLLILAAGLVAMLAARRH